ncbi:MAG: hypothetical protein WCK71_01865 [bacterium]
MATIVVIGDIGIEEFTPLYASLSDRDVEPVVYFPNWGEMLGTLNGKIYDSITQVAVEHCRNEFPREYIRMSVSRCIKRYMRERLPHLSPGRINATVYRSSQISSGQGNDLVKILYNYWYGYFFDLDDQNPFGMLD